MFNERSCDDDNRCHLVPWWCYEKPVKRISIRCIPDWSGGVGESVLSLFKRNYFKDVRMWVPTIIAAKGAVSQNIHKVLLTTAKNTPPKSKSIQNIVSNQWQRNNWNWAQKHLDLMFLVNRSAQKSWLLIDVRLISLIDIGNIRRTKPPS